MFDVTGRRVGGRRVVGLRALLLLAGAEADDVVIGLTREPIECVRGFLGAEIEARLRLARAEWRLQVYRPPVVRGRVGQLEALLRLACYFGVLELAVVRRDLNWGFGLVVLAVLSRLGAVLRIARRSRMWLLLIQRVVGALQRLQLRCRAVQVAGAQVGAPDSGRLIFVRLIARLDDLRAGARLAHWRVDVSRW